MRNANAIRLLAVLLLIGGMLAVTIPDMPGSGVVRAQGNSDGKKDDKANDRPGKEKKDKDKQDKDDKDNGNGPVISGDGGYRVEVACDNDDDGTSTCTFTGVVPDGGKKINHLDVPEEAICAEVVGGEYKYVDDDPHTGVTGYQTKGNNDTVTLVLDGHAVPAGTATYWLKAANNILPVTGPGIDCGSGMTSGLPTTPEGAAPTVTPAPETGELVVLVYTCADVPEDTTDYDWFRLCDSEGGVHQLALAPVSEVAVEPMTTSTDDSGDATFTDLEPGLYTLEMTDVAWCKAVSDSVDAEGNVIIEQGQRTTVYSFICEDQPAA
jgi:hypothetical protein